MSEGVSVGDIKAVDCGHDTTVEELIKGGKLVFASRVPELNNNAVNLSIRKWKCLPYLDFDRLFLDAHNFGVEVNPDGGGVDLFEFILAEPL